jgi:hypothetical protein
LQQHNFLDNRTIRIGAACVLPQSRGADRNTLAEVKIADLETLVNCAQR